MPELKSLNFSTPKRKYESFASFENEKGQQFIVRVRGYEKAAVQQHIKNLRAYLEVVPGESIQLAEEDILSEAEPEQNSSPGETRFLEDTIDLDLNSELEVAFKIAKIPNINHPYVLNFQFGRADIQEVPIKEGESHPISYPIGTKPRVTVNVTSGKVKFELFQYGQAQPLDTIEVSKPGDHILSATEIKIPNARFYVRATGLGIHQSEYTIDGTLTIVSLNGVKDHWL